MNYFNNTLPAFKYDAKEKMNDPKAGWFIGQHNSIVNLMLQSESTQTKNSMLPGKSRILAVQDEDKQKL